MEAIILYMFIIFFGWQSAVKKVQTKQKATYGLFSCFPEVRIWSYHKKSSFVSKQERKSAIRQNLKKFTASHTKSETCC